MNHELSERSNGQPPPLSTTWRAGALIVMVTIAASLSCCQSEKSPRESGRAGRKEGRTAPGPGPAADTASPVSAVNGEISVFFSNAYANNPKVGENDPNNIDRHLADVITHARSTVDCAFFELKCERIAAALIAAKQRGVRVRLVADSDFREDAEMQEVLAARIPVVFDERSAFMHDKFVIADAVLVWTGSYNATDNCSYRNNNNALLLHSAELAENYTAEFEEMFNDGKFGPRSPSATPHSFVKLGDADVYNYFGPEDEPQTKILRFLKAAKQSVHFLAFSFTDQDIGSVLVERHQNGVQVEGVVERRNSDARGAQMGPLMAAGIPVLQDGNTYVMHHKVFVIDGTWTITGSYNFTSSGANQNDENVLVIRSPAVARAFEGEYQRIKRMAQQSPVVHVNARAGATNQ
ncbi:MAG TPA: phospholipase D-like domain-containing protein [Candidatus Kapabacteria bacterium]|nr:phospholipase D-like domain-containing protein [Candidatus Kapabacteria bacterium]